MAKPDPSALNMDRFRSLLVESVGVGLAIVEPSEFRVILHNPMFSEMFPSVQNGEATLAALLPDFDAQVAADQLASNQSWKCEVAIKPKRRTVALLVELVRAEGSDSGEIMVQCQNVSKVKELEYLIESYSKMIERQNRDLKKEKERVEKLLLNIMPPIVYEEWKKFGVTTPRRFDDATVLMLDFIGFTQMSIAHDPTKLISELNDIFTSFDRIVEQFGCERLKTIGDAYLAVSGMPEHNPDHARNIARSALLFVRYLKRRNETSEFNWTCRIGINSGSVIGSVVGVQKYVYDIFGPGVNLAARLESLCGPMEILLSEHTYALIENQFRVSDKGVRDIRGFGETRIYRLDGDFEGANDGRETR